MQRLKRIVDTLLPGEDAVQTRADELLLQLWKQTSGSGSSRDLSCHRSRCPLDGRVAALGLGVLLARLKVYARDENSDAVHW